MDIIIGFGGLLLTLGTLFAGYIKISQSVQTLINERYKAMSDANDQRYAAMELENRKLRREIAEIRSVAVQARTVQQNLSSELKKSRSNEQKMARGMIKLRDLVSKLEAKVKALEDERDSLATRNGELHAQVVANNERLQDVERSSHQEITALLDRNISLMSDLHTERQSVNALKLELTEFQTRLNNNQEL